MSALKPFVGDELYAHWKKVGYEGLDPRQLDAFREAARHALVKGMLPSLSHSDIQEKFREAAALVAGNTTESVMSNRYRGVTPQKLWRGFTDWRTRIRARKRRRAISASGAGAFGAADAAGEAGSGKISGGV